MKHITTLVLFGCLLCFGMAYSQDEPTPPDDPALADDPAPTDDPALPDSAQGLAPAPAPASMVMAIDKDNDQGHAMIVTWEKSADDGAGNKSVIGYQILRSNSPEGPWAEVGKVPFGDTEYDNTGSKNPNSNDFIPDFTDFYYRVDALTADTLVKAPSGVAGPVQSFGQLFHTGKAPVLIAVVLFGILTIYFVNRAKKGADLYVRPLAGIEAVDDAIGRATEMGKPILYVLGLGSAADIATIASFTILGRVAKRVAEYHTSIIVPTYDPIVMTVAQEVVKSSYMDAGFPDEYQEDSVFFVTQSQFAYVAAVNGIMLRDLPATNIYMGKFFAESLILSETGAVAGSIQIAGTDEIAQIPFFITACDFTLIAEELYAASAYLSQEPILLGSLKAQDYAKAAVIVLAILGTIAANFGWTDLTELFKVVE